VLNDPSGPLVVGFIAAWLARASFILLGISSLRARVLPKTSGLALIAAGAITLVPLPADQTVYDGDHWNRLRRGRSPRAHRSSQNPAPNTVSNLTAAGPVGGHPPASHLRRPGRRRRIPPHRPQATTPNAPHSHDDIATGPDRPPPRGFHPMSDDQPTTTLMTRAADGDKQAWHALVERYTPLIWSICRSHRLGNADAEDVGQSVWLRLVEQLHKIRDPAALPGWLATTTRRECLRVQGAVPRLEMAGYALDAEAIPDERTGTAEQELLAAERHAALRCARRSWSCHQAASG
jgi:hypothetical protein